MSKLIKLTTTLDKVRDTNGYLCISDNDIILEPNAKVSLLNAHISSGVVANYKIAGDDSLGQITAGQIIGNIQLGDTTDRKRDVIIPNGTYDINPLVESLNDAMNDSLVFKSTTSYPGSGSNTLNTPADLDFGIATQTSITTDNKVKISFNNASQKTTVDIKYTNTSPGIVNTNGIISYTGGAGQYQVGLQPLKQGVNFVLTEDEIGTNLNPFDAITLIDSTSPGGGTQANYTISAISLDGTNLDTVLTLNPAKTDPATPFVITQGTNYTTTSPYNVGDKVTLDDGTGTGLVPSATRAYGEVANAELVFENDNTFINGLAGERIQELFLRHEIKTVTPGPNVNEYVILLNTPFIGSAQLKLIDDSVHWILNSNLERYACLQIIATQDKNNAIEITAIVQLLDAQPIDISQFAWVLNAQFIYSTPGKTDALNTYLQEGVLGLFDSNYNLLVTFGLQGVPVLGQDQVDPTIQYYIWELLVNSWKTSDPNSPNPAQLTGLDAFTQFTKATYKTGTFDIATCFLTNTDRVINVSNTATTNFAQAENFIICEQSLVNQTALTMSAPKVVFNNYEIYPIQFPANDIFPSYASFFKIFLAGSASPWLMVRNSLDRNIKLTLTNLAGPTLPLTNALIRIWVGTDVVNTYKIEVNFTSPSQRLRATYDLLSKGAGVPVGQANAFALGDDRLTHSCGRIAFKLIKSAIGTEFGIMPESANFNNLTIPSADYSIKLVTSPSGPAYSIYRKGIQVRSGSLITAYDGDTIIIQWGVTSSSNDFEYNNTLNPASSVSTIFNNITTNNNQVDPLADTYDLDRNKILVTVIRNGDVGGGGRFVHIGSTFNLPPQGSAVTANQIRACKVIPWTPRNRPYIQPQYWSQGNFRVFIKPNLGQVSTLELTPTPALVTDPLTGALNVFDGSNHIYHPDLHGSSNLELLDQPASKFGSFANTFIFNFTDPTFQNQLGYKTSSKTVAGLSGSWIADIEYLRAYLPEGLVILLENLGVDTFDCGQLTGSRRNIIATCINTQQKLGDISVEPSNLYRIAIGNKTPINLRKFALAFEDLYGKQLILASAKVCVSLLFEN